MLYDKYMNTFSMKLRNQAFGALYCLDTHGKKPPAKMGVFQCHTQGGHQVKKMLEN